MSAEPLVQVDSLSKVFSRGGGLLRRPRAGVRALDEVSLAVHQGETVGVVGESGCGKTTLGRIIMGMIEPTGGSVRFDGDPVREMQMVFQNPYSSFDPRFTISRSVAEPLVTHTTLRGAPLRSQVRELLDSVGMPGDIANRYPHELSGGQLQRIAIARAIALNPKFLVLDEPTSALDVSVQAQVINLLQKLKRELGLTLLFISHDLGVVRHVSDRVVVMYLGKVVEVSDSRDLFAGLAKHPYTEALLSSVVTVAKDLQQERVPLSGSVPDGANPPPGCPFHPRCPYAFERCRHEEPELTPTENHNVAACHLITEKENIDAER